MGGSQCKCFGEGDVNEKAYVLPPPGEEFNVARVTIVALRGYSQADVGKSYCTCKIPGKADYCMTQVRPDGKWDFDCQVTDYQVGDPLLFQVWEDEAKGRSLVGKVLLPAAQISQHGFSGELTLEETKGNVQAFLEVKADLAYVDASTSVKQQPAVQEALAGSAVVVVTFYKQQNSAEEIRLNFTKAPLGMSFDADRMPIVINALNGKGQAKDLGVNVGMVIAKIDGVDITGMKYDEAFALMREKVKFLPREES